MSEVQGGAAYIDLKARDNTAPAFKSVNEHFKDFKDNLKNVEDNLKPFQEFLKGGLAVGGIIGCVQNWWILCRWGLMMRGVKN